MTSRTGQAIKGGFKLKKSSSVYETSDSDAGPASSSRSAGGLVRKKQSGVPMVMEPDLEEIDEHFDARSGGWFRSDKGLGLHLACRSTQRQLWPCF
jgi:hypothetical protein